MIPHQPFFYIARLVLETCTPLSIASGRTDGIVDNLIVRDANGLPAIPGSSLAGVLRYLYQRHYQDADQLFGAEENKPSFVHVSWGCLHNSHDQPIEELLVPNEIQDVVLKNAQQSMPIMRDHVKLNHRSVSDAAKQSKFDRVSLTTGHRFSVELSLWSDHENEPRWQNLLNLLQGSDFRLGGGTRRGLGKLKIVRCHTGQFNLSNPAQFQLFSELSQSLADTKHLDSFKAEAKDNLPKIKLVLTPVDGYGYRFGSGTEPLAQNSQANLLTVTERCIDWNGGKGQLSRKKVLIPASSVKGALSHRVAYYYNALTNRFVETVQESAATFLGENNEAIKALFGYVQDKAAQVGSLIFDDVYLERDRLQAIEYAHNGVDRFTGGVREGVLFFEEVLKDSQSFPLIITVANEEKPEPLMWQALELALTDLVQGRLALGAGGGRGHGYFKGKWDPKGKNWLKSKVSGVETPKVSVEVVKSSVQKKASGKKRKKNKRR